MIDQYYLGSDCYFLVKYFSDERRNSGTLGKRRSNYVRCIRSLSKQEKVQNPPKEYVLRKAEESDAILLADLYRTVFEVYPTPMNDPIIYQKVYERGYCIFHLQV